MNIVNQNNPKVEFCKKCVMSNQKVLPSVLTDDTKDHSNRHNIPFKNEIVLSYTGKKSGAIFSYNTKKEKWRYIQDQEDDSLIANINSGNIFAILNETKKPKISDIFPSNNSTYNIEDLNYISFNIRDEESGINQNSIKIYLNKILQYYEYIPYRNLIRTNIDKGQIMDENYLEISLKDNIGNEKYYKGIFYKE